MSKIYDGIMGLVIGDALGVPFEFKERDSFRCTDMTGYGTYYQPPGTWSDDSSMTLATLQGLVDCKGKINLNVIMSNFYTWYYEADFTPYNSVFDVGNTTRNAIERYRFSGFNLQHYGGGGNEVTDNGNGSLMRILPLAFVPCSFGDICNVSALTHAHKISVDACLLYINVIHGLLSGLTKEKAIKEALEDYQYAIVPVKELERLESVDKLHRTQIKSTGYVVDTLEAALWCLLKTDSYKDCVLTAVNLGGDTDTIAAVAGGLAGVLYGTGGEKGIPEEWISQIPRKEWISKLCDQLEKIPG